MNRREFVKGAAFAASLQCVPAVWAKANRPEIAFTFDDPKVEASAGLSWTEINERILSVLHKRNIQAALFVCGKRIDSAEGKQLVGEWDRAGHLIGNHSYSHLYFHSDKVPLDDFEADALKNESLIHDCRNFVHLFRYPFFKEGDTAEKRDGMRLFLQKHQYRIGRATIDVSDWAINARMEKRWKTDSRADLTAYRDFFLQHIWERAEFYHSLGERVLKHPVRHTVLLHYSGLNALFLGDLMEMFVAKGGRR